MITVLPIFGDQAVYIPRNKLKDKYYGDWSDEEEDWAAESAVDGVVLILDKIKDPKPLCVLPPLSERLDLFRSVLSLRPRE